MTTTDSTELKVIKVAFWFIFIVLCLKTATILLGFIVSLFLNPKAANGIWGLNLSDLYSYNKLHYIFTVSLLLTLTGLKAYIAYFVVKFFPKFNLSKPFNNNFTELFIRISHIAFGAGALATIANNYTKWIMKGIAIPIDWGENEILFFAGVIYFLAFVFKKGTELQTENDSSV